MARSQKTGIYILQIMNLLMILFHGSEKMKINIILIEHILERTLDIQQQLIIWPAKAVLK